MEHRVRVTSPLTRSLTLILDEVYAVVWKVGSTTYQSDVVASGNDLTLPTPPNPEAVGYPGYYFIGWTAAPKIENTSK